MCVYALMVVGLYRMLIVSHADCTSHLLIHHHGLCYAILNYAILCYTLYYAICYTICYTMLFYTQLYYMLYSIILCAGAVFGNTPHIVQVDEFSDLFAFRLIDNGPASYILSFKNQDRPGAISEVRTVKASIRYSCRAYHCDDNLS